MDTAGPVGSPSSQTQEPSPADSPVLPAAASVRKRTLPTPASLQEVVFREIPGDVLVEVLFGLPDESPVVVLVVQ